MTSPELRLEWWRDWPALVVLGSCTFLQRFGLPLGPMPVPLVLPITAGVFAVLLVQNRLRVSKLGLGAYLAMASWFICVSALANAMPSPSSAPSMSSLWYFLAAYVFLVFRWHPAPGMHRTLWIFRGFVTVLAWCGILQFAAQFAGLRLFEFRGLVPDAFLIESGYNLVIALKMGSGVYKSNGMFLLEPSIFSQFSAVALVIEFLYFGSRLRMALFTLALVVAFSGTGLLVLGFALTMAVLLERGASGRVFSVVAVAAATVLLFSLLPGSNYLGLVANRATEVGAQGSSGSLRFITPYQAVFDIAADPRLLIGFGPGTSEHFSTVPYRYAVNAITKVLIEYGIPGLAAYGCLMLSTLYRAKLRVLSAVGAFWFVFGGGYHLAPAILFSLAVLFAWGPSGREAAPTPPPAEPYRTPIPVL